MKIKMKLFLLCAAVAPFLMMTSSQQNGSRFGCVCAFEKGNSNKPNENPAPASDTESFDEVARADLWDRFNQNKEILRQYASANNTLDYFYFERIVGFLAEDKDDSIESFKNKLKKKAVDWLDFCFLSAFLEGLLASRYQNFVSMEHNIKNEFPKGFPFAEWKKLTCSMWTQIKSIGFNFIGFYHGLICLMHCRESEFFDFIYCLAKVRLPYMQLFIAFLINFSFKLATDIDWSALINILYKFHVRFDDEDEGVVESFISCFNFNSELEQALLDFYSLYLRQKYADSANILSDLASLGCSRFIDAVSELNFSWYRKKLIFDFVDPPIK